MSAQEIARSFDFLETRLRDYPDRHRNIRAVLDPSLETLTERDRLVLETLCLFRGRFTREAAEAITGATVHSLALLVSKSLIRYLPSGYYEIHELVRQYGELRLNSKPGQHAAARERYCVYYADFLEARWHKMQTAMRNEPFEQIDAELPNITLAFQFMLEDRRAAQIWQSINALWNYFAIRFRFNEGAVIFSKGIRLLDSSPYEALVGSLLVREAYFLATLNAPDQANQRLAEGFRLLEASQESVPVDAWLIAHLCATLIAWVAGDWRRVYAAVRRALDYATAHQHPFGIRTVLCFMADAELKLGRMDQARANGYAAYEMALKQGDLWTQSLATLIVLAEDAYARREYREARHWCQIARQCIASDLQQTFVLALAARNLAIYAIALHEFAEAQTHLNECIQIFEDHGVPWQIPVALLLIARLLVREQRPDHAVHLLAVALHQPACRPADQEEALQLLSQLQTALPAKRFAAAWEQGQVCPPREALAALVAEENSRAPYLDGLSMRELDVLHLLAGGFSNAEIAQQLCLSVGTVKVHTRHIYHKLEVNNRAQAVLQAQKRGIL